MMRTRNEKIDIWIACIMIFSILVVLSLIVYFVAHGRRL